MTSKNSFSKEALGLDRKLLWEKMRHSLWAISLFTLILFFSHPGARYHGGAKRDPPRAG